MTIGADAGSIPSSRGAQTESALPATTFSARKIFRTVERDGEYLVFGDQ